MNPITRECEDCASLQDVLADIDCTLLDVTNRKYNALIYNTQDCCNEELYNDLIWWKRIITGRLYNCFYPCSSYTSNELLSYVRLLTYKTRCSRCPECEEIIPSTTTTTFPPGEGVCVSYLVICPSPEGNSVNVPYSYIDCEGVLVTGVINQYQALNICAVEHSVVVTNTFTVTLYDTECDIVPEDCLCMTMTNIEEGPGVEPYVFSYEDCDGGIFTDLPLDFGDTTQICYRPSTLVLNFGINGIMGGACIDTCN